MVRHRIWMGVALGCAAWPAFGADEAMVAETRKTAMQLVGQLGSTLQEELKKGPDAAIGVCKDVAAVKAVELSRQTGWRISRVSQKVRNPLLGIPDAWEAAALADFDKRAAAGEDPAKLEKAETVTEGGRQYLRYIKALPVQSVCVTCHGPEDKIPAEVKARLKMEYPHDRAVGYQAGQIRGGLTVKRPL